MAAVTKLNTRVFGHTQPAGTKEFSDGKEIFFCFVSSEFTGTYASAGNANILLLTTEIANSRRDGKTIALLSACFVAPVRENSVVVGADTVAVSTTGITCQLTQADGTTEHADGALVAFQEPVVFGITYTAA